MCWKGVSQNGQERPFRYLPIGCSLGRLVSSSDGADNGMFLTVGSKSDQFSCANQRPRSTSCTPKAPLKRKAWSVARLPPTHEEKCCRLCITSVYRGVNCRKPALLFSCEKKMNLLASRSCCSGAYFGADEDMQPRHGRRLALSSRPDRWCWCCCCCRGFRFDNPQWTILTTRRYGGEKTRKHMGIPQTNSITPEY